MAVDVNINIRTLGGPVAQKAFQAVGKSAGSTATIVDDLRKKLKSLLGLFLVRQVQLYADSYAQLQNRLRLVTSSTGELAAVTRNLADISRRTRTDFALTGELYARVSLATADLGKSSSETARFVETVNKLIQASGVNAREAQAGLIQFSQGLASNRLAGDELKSVLEGIPALGRAIAAGLGVSFGELRELGKQQKLTASALFEALSSQAGSVDKLFGGTVATVSTGLTALNNSVEQVIGQFDQTFKISQTLAEGLTLVADKLEDITKALAVLLITWGTFRATTLIAGALEAGKLATALDSVAASLVALQTAGLGLFSLLAIPAAFAAVLSSALLFRKELDNLFGVQVGTIINAGIVAIGDAVGQSLDRLIKTVNSKLKGLAGQFLQLVPIFLNVTSTLLIPAVQGLLKAVFGSYVEGIGDFFLKPLQNQIEKLRPGFRLIGELGASFTQTALNEALAGDKRGLNPEGKNLGGDFVEAFKERLKEFENLDVAVPADLTDFAKSLDKQLKNTTETIDKQGDKVLDFFQKLRKSVSQVEASPLELEQLKGLDQFRRETGRGADVGEAIRIRAIVAERERLKEAIRAQEEAQKAVNKALEEEEKRQAKLAETRKKILEFFRELQAETDRLNLPEIELEKLSALDQFRGQFGREATAQEEERIRSIVEARERYKDVLKEQDAIQAGINRRQDEELKKQKQITEQREKFLALGRKEISGASPIGAARIAAQKRIQTVDAVSNRDLEAGFDISTVVRAAEAAKAKILRETEKARNPFEFTKKALDEQIRLLSLTEAQRSREVEFIRVKNDLLLLGFNLEEDTTGALTDQIKERTNAIASLRKQKEVVKDLGDEINKSIVQGLSKATDQLAEFLVSGQRGALDFSKVLQGLAQQLASIALKQLILKPLLGGLFGGGGTASVAAPAVSAAPVPSFQLASGGVLNNPTFFSAGGQLGQAGEAGKEGVLPLRRNSRGQLGVIATGGGGGGTTIGKIETTVNINGGDGSPADIADAGRSAALETNLAIRAAIQSEILKQSRNGGALNQQVRV